MSRKISITIICIIILASLAISIYIPSRQKIEETEDTTINYTILEENGKYGISKNEETIIEPQYDEIIIPNSHRAVFLCENSEEQKFVNEENKTIFEDYDSVNLIEIIENEYEKNMLIYEQKGKFGLLGITGKTITKAEYEEIFSSGYKEGEVIVKENGKYGILDEKGNYKIKCKYDSIKSDEYYTEEDKYKKSGYIVQLTTDDGYRYGYYDTDGEQVLTEEYNQITRLTQIESEDIYLITAKNGQYGVFVNNAKIINTQYQAIEYNSDLEIFIVERTEKFGATNLKGNEILKTEYDELRINGIYIYTIKGEEKKVWNINREEVDINFETVIQKTETEYFIKIEDGYYSILNSNFEAISENKYKYLEYSYNNCFIATNEQDKTGVIDIQENIVIDFIYDSIQKVKGSNSIQAIDFTTNITTTFDEDYKIITE